MPLTRLLDEVGIRWSLRELGRHPSRSDLQALLRFGGFPEPDHKTAERWLHILENLYVCFRVSLYGPPRVRAVTKERKLYLWDWSSVEGDGPRFETWSLASFSSTLKREN